MHFYSRLPRRETDGGVLTEIAGYELSEPLGSGAGGTVHKARQVSGDRVVAIKRVEDAALAERLQHEGVVQAGLEHPHILRVYDLVPDGDGFAIVMQHAAGGTLSDRMASAGPADEATALRVIGGLGEALAFAHNKGVVHRDVKPSNVLFDSAGTVLLADFGLAASSDDIVQGSAAYLDPLLLEGHPPSPASDIYSLAVVAYELLSGQLPYQGSTADEIVESARAGELVPLSTSAPQVTPAVADVITEALRTDDEARYSDAQAFVTALKDAAGPAPAPSTAVTAAGDDDARGTRAFGPRPEPPEKAKERRLPWPVVGAMAFALVALPVLGVTLVTGGDDDENASQTATEREAAEEVEPFQGIDPLLSELMDEMDCDDEEPEIEGADEIHMARLEPGTCPVPVHREGGTLVAHPEEDEELRFDVGASDDIVFIADFTCTGRDTPAVYRADTGEVFVFERWADEQRPVIEVEGFNSGVTFGVPDVQVDSSGCADLEIQEPPGSI